MNSGGVVLFFVALVGPAKFPSHARNYRSRIPGVDGVVALLAALAPLYQMILLDSEMAASEGVVHLARRFAAWVLQAIEQAVKQAAQDCSEK